MVKRLVVNKDFKNPVEANLGDDIEIQLDENISTGYSWILEEGDLSILEMVNSSYVDSQGTALGRPGTRILHFRVKSRGIQQIVLILRRVWEPLEKIAEIIKIEVRVE